MLLDYLDISKNVIKAYIYFTLFHFLASKIKNRFFLFIILLNAIIILLSDLLIHYKISIEFICNIYAILHPILWFIILGEMIKSKIAYYLISLFLFGIVLNLCLIDSNISLNKFNTANFVMGSLLYVAAFIYISFLELQKENINLLLSNTYLLVSSPVLFFIGISFIYGFENSALDNTVLFLNFKLYNIVNLFTNLIFYTLINLYIHKERRLNNV